MVNSSNKLTDHPRDFGKIVNYTGNRAVKYGLALGVGGGSAALAATAVTTFVLTLLHMLGVRVPTVANLLDKAGIGGRIALLAGSAVIAAYSAFFSIQFFRGFKEPLKSFSLQAGKKIDEENV